MKRLSGIKAVSFDADGTLWDFKEVTRRSLSYALKELEDTNPEAARKLDVEKMIAIRDRVAEELKEKAFDLERVRLEAFRRTLEEVVIEDEDLAAHLTSIYLKHLYDDIESFGDVLPTLSILGKKYRLGVISNGNSHPERCGLKGIFNFAVLSQDFGVEKPDLGIFRIALAEAGCSRWELVHVGDSLENDVRGAINAGVLCVWLNRGRLENDTDIAPEYEISSLSKLLDIL